MQTPTCVLAESRWTTASSVQIIFNHYIPCQPLNDACPITMLENLCTLPLTSDLFSQALHPTEAVLAVGLSSGHVQSFRLPPVAGFGSEDEDGNTGVLSTGTSTIDTEWRTRRHKGSCRTLAYSGDGEGALPSDIGLSSTDNMSKSYIPQAQMGSSKLPLQ